MNVSTGNDSFLSTFVTLLSILLFFQSIKSEERRFLWFYCQNLWQRRKIFDQSSSFLWTLESHSIALKLMYGNPMILNHEKKTYDLDSIIELNLWLYNNQIFSKMLLRYFIFFSGTWTFKINDSKSLTRIDENCP